MEKAEFIFSQLKLFHTELSKMKKFYYSSHQHFKKFSIDMQNTLNQLKQSNNIFNEIEFMNYINLKSIHYFVDFISEKSEENLLNYTNLKKEEYKIKITEQNLKKNIKTFKKSNKNNSVNKNEDLEKETEKAFDILCKIKDSIKNSFDSYINSLCSFSETKNKIKQMKEKYEKQFNKEFNTEFKLNLIFHNSNSNYNSPRFNYSNNNNYYNYSNSNEDRVDKIIHFFSSVNKKDKQIFNSKKVFSNDIENPELINNTDNIFKKLNPNIIINDMENNNKDKLSISFDDYESDFSIEKIKRLPNNSNQPFIFNN